jgi:RHS repeat-associated protein
MKISRIFSQFFRGAFQTIKLCAFLPGLMTLVLPPNLMLHAMEAPANPLPVDCCGSLGAGMPEEDITALLPPQTLPPSNPPKEFFKSSDRRVKPHSGRISLLNLDLKRPPTEEELIQCGQLGSPLSPSKSADAEKVNDPIKKQHQHRDNHLFGKAMQKWNEHAYDEAVVLFRQHRQEFADSAWAGEAELHMGCQAQFSGNWKAAGDHFQTILSTHQKGQDIWQKAMLRRAVLHYQQAELDAAASTFAEMLKTEQSWERRTYVESLLRHTSLMQGHLASLKVCGPESLSYIFNTKGLDDKAAEVLKQKAPSDVGFKLGELANLSVDSGVKVYPISANISALTSLPTPFIAHYKDRHYTVVTDSSKVGKVFVYDPRLKRVTELETDQFLEQWSGKAILFEPIPSGIDPASAAELQSEAGGCCGLPRYPDDLGSDCPKDCCGMPEWEVNPVNMNLLVQDVPIWHKSAAGPNFELRITYNSQDSLNQLRPFGNKWMSTFTTYAVESPAQGGSGDVLIVMPDGRGQTFKPNGSGGYTSPKDNFNVLTKTGAYQFDLTMPDGMIYRYGPPTVNSTSSLLKAIIDRYNLSVTVNYDANGLIDSVTGPQGNVFDFSYDSNGRVTRIDDPWGRYATFNYNASGDLTDQRDMGGLTYSYTYDANKNLTSIVKPSGTWGFYVEPADGVINGSNPYPPSGGAMWMNYRITITDPLGYKEEYHYNATNRSTWYRDKNQYLSVSTAVNAPKTRYLFALVGGSGGKGVLSQIITADGRVTYLDEYESTSNPTVTKKPRKITDENSGITRRTFNPQGRVLTETDPRNNVTTLTYKPNGFDLESVTDALGRQVLQLAYANGTRNIQTITQYVSDTESRINQFTYNSVGQIETITTPKNELFTLEYYPINDPIAPRRFKALHRGSITGAVLASVTYDAKGRQLTTTDANNVTLNYAYDNLDRLTTITYPDNTSEQTNWGCCRILSTRDRLGRVTQFQYDRTNRLITQRDALGRFTQFRYDPQGNLIKLTDGAGNATRWEYDLRNRMTRKIYADGSQFIQEYLGRYLRKTRDARGVEFTYTHDADGNLTGMQTTSVPSGIPSFSVSFTYDNLNNRETMSDEIGTTTWTYNRQHEVTGQTTQASSSAWTDTFVYGRDLNGRVNSRTINGSSNTMTYDDLARVTSMTNPLGTFTIGYKTPISPLLESVSVPNGPTTQFQYDASIEYRRVSQITNTGAGNTLLSKFTYTHDANGGVKTMLREGFTVPGSTGSSSEYVFTQDTEDQLIGAVLRDPSTQNVIKSFGYQYDAAGNRNVETIGSSNTALTKDTLNNLNQVTQRGAGNTLPIRGTTNEPVAAVTINGSAAKIDKGTQFAGQANVNVGNNTVTVAATDFGQPPNTTTKQYQVAVAAGITQTLTYDINGNLLSDGTCNFEWDALNRMAAIVQGNNRTEFRYDGLSRRTQIIEKNNTTGIINSNKRFVWDGLTMVEERDGAGNQLNKRYFAAGFQQISGANAGSYFYTRDELGNIRELVSSSGTIRARYDYDPYGQRVKLSGDLDSDFGFTGHYEHAITGITLAPFRAYSSNLGRWLSRDPIGEAGGLNLYCYVLNSPANRYDPHGYFAPLVWAAIVAGAALGAKAIYDLLSPANEFANSYSEAVNDLNNLMSDSTHAEDCVDSAKEHMTNAEEAAKTLADEIAETASQNMFKPPILPNPSIGPGYDDAVDDVRNVYDSMFQAYEDWLYDYYNP